MVAESQIGMDDLRVRGITAPPNAGVVGATPVRRAIASALRKTRGNRLSDE